MAPATDESIVSSPRHESIEERALIGALMCIYGHFLDKPPLGPKSKAKVRGMIDKALKKTHKADIRAHKFGPNVELWLWLSKIFEVAVPSLERNSLGEPSADNSTDYPDCTSLIVKNYVSLRDELQMLITIMEIARNILICEYKLVPQEICAAVRFHEQAYRVLTLCVRINTIAKGPEEDYAAGPDLLENVIEIHEIFQQLSVATIQQLHNWVVSHNRNKTEFFATFLMCDTDAYGADQKHNQVTPHPDQETACRQVIRRQVTNWLNRNSVLHRATRVLLQDYVQHERPDMKKANVGLPMTEAFLASNYLAGMEDLSLESGDNGGGVWDPNEEDKVEQDRKYRRMSHEIDEWYEKVRDGKEVKPMSTVEFGQFHQTSCYEAFLQVCSGLTPEGEPVGPAGFLGAMKREPARMPTDLLYRLTTVLDQNQIEGLFRLVKTCVMDAQNDGDEDGERYQKTRCRMLLALPAGQALVQGLLDFVDMWDSPPEGEIYRQMRDIVLGLHQNFLIPYAWEQFSSPHHLISPTQAVLLRLMTDILRAGISLSEKTAPAFEKVRLATHAHFFFGTFRTSIVPQMVAIMHVQAQIRQGKLDPKSMPLTGWQMLKAKTGLCDYLELIDVLAQAPDTRKMLIEWEAVFEFITLLIALDKAIPKLPLDPKAEGQALGEQQNQEAGKKAKKMSPASPGSTKAHRGSDDSDDDHTFDDDDSDASPSYPGEGYKHTWTGVKGPIFTLIATLLQPTTGRSSPGNPTVQKQVLQHNGLPALLSCMSYDGHQPYARERVTLCLKWLVEGNKDASEWFRNMITNKQSESSSSAGPSTSPNDAASASAPPLPPLQAPGVMSVKVDGVGEVKVKIGTNPPPRHVRPPGEQEKMPSGKTGGMTQLEEDFMA